jgi:hypothetical protein
MHWNRTWTQAAGVTGLLFFALRAASCGTGITTSQYRCRLSDTWTTIEDSLGEGGGACAVSSILVDPSGGLYYSGTSGSSPVSSLLRYLPPGSSNWQTLDLFSYGGGWDAAQTTISPTIALFNGTVLSLFNFFFDGH